MSNSGQEHPGYQGNWGNQTPCLCHKQTLDSVSSLSPSELPKGGMEPSLPLVTHLTMSSSPTVLIRQTMVKDRTQTVPMSQVDTVHPWVPTLSWSGEPCPGWVPDTHASLNAAEP